MTERACRVCGCTQNTACLTPDGPCYWVEWNLCSGCAPQIEWTISQHQLAYHDRVLARRREKPVMRDHGREAIDRLNASAKSDDPTLEAPKVG